MKADKWIMDIVISCCIAFAGFLEMKKGIISDAWLMVLVGLVLFCIGLVWLYFAVKFTIEDMRENENSDRHG